ncbi:MAG TPA: pseudouridine synthase, partial [Planctomycetota bacterium]|nr:pseudouridine synthase [Planctomycetota bacterium]
KTLERYLSRAGLCSRSEARGLIAAGRVSVQGRVERQVGRWIDEERTDVRVDGKPVRAARPVYFLLNKPKDCLTTASDPQGRRTVYDLLEDVRDWVVPVGRLDRDTTGLLLLTNDTELADAVTDPATGMPKTYMVKSTTRLADEQLASLARGIELDDGPTAPARVRRLRDGDHRTFLEITITEGRNRQVRRMLEAVGSGVMELKRTAIGPLRMEGLAMGKYRRLKAEELAALRRAAGRPRAARRGQRGGGG